jgi:hypothetical protein
MVVSRRLLLKSVCTLSPTLRLISSWRLERVDTVPCRTGFPSSGVLTVKCGGSHIFHSGTSRSEFTAPTSSEVVLTTWPFCWSPSPVFVFSSLFVLQFPRFGSEKKIQEKQKVVNFSIFHVDTRWQGEHTLFGTVSCVTVWVWGPMVYQGLFIDTNPSLSLFDSSSILGIDTQMREVPRRVWTQKCYLYCHTHFNTSRCLQVYVMIFNTSIQVYVMTFNTSVLSPIWCSMQISLTLNLTEGLVRLVGTLNVWVSINTTINQSIH